MSKSSASKVSTLGVLGGGQLGRMILQAASKLGIEGHVYSDEDMSPACQVAANKTIASYKDENALRKFAETCDVVTYEFENIPLDSLDSIEKIKEIRPCKKALATFQNRILEKEFLRNNGVPCADFAVVDSLQGFEEGLKKVKLPSVLKTAGMGYDGKGQTKLKTQEDIELLKKNWQENSYVLESYLNLKSEFSVVAARSISGEFKSWGAIENEHRNHILHISLAPGRIEQAIKEQALQITNSIASAIGYVGVFCVEFFITEEGNLLVNEIAPRVHNSGHLTIEASECSQFEQHVRAVCGLPFGNTEIIKPFAMLNLLGDLWKAGEPDWDNVSENYNCAVHLYGKKDAKKGRKMGHLTFSADSANAAYAKAEMIFRELSKD